MRRPAAEPVAWTYPADRYYYSWYETTPPTPPPDSEVKVMLVDRLRRNPRTKDDRIEVEVSHGVVILTGGVSSTLAKRAAGDDAWDTPGVTDVSNQLSVLHD